MYIQISIACGLTTTCRLIVAAGTSWRPGAASLVWQMQALKALDRDLQQKYGAGAAIIYKHGPYLKALKEIADALNIGVIYYSKR